MRCKVLVTMVLIAVLLTLSPLVWAAEAGEGDVVPEPRPYFVTYKGTITEVSDYKPIKGAQFVSIEDEDGNPVNIIVTADTYLVNEGELDVGQEITSFIDARKPVILIYPPQYQAEALIVGEFEGNVKADLFDENFVSSDKMLKLNLAEDTELLWKDGSVFEGTVANKKLFVIYGPSTKSIPAQTSPMKVVVLSPSSKSDLGGENKAIVDYATLEIVVDKEKIEAPAPYANEKGVVMVPLRPIVEALGLSVDWDGEKRSIAIGENISLTIGRDNYKGPWTTSALLGAAPKLVESRTYVPLAFFTELVGLNKAYVFENQIIISSGS